MIKIRGVMDDGSPCWFSVEQPCGLTGFIGRCLDADPGIFCKPGFIPFHAVNLEDLVNAAFADRK